MSNKLVDNLMDFWFMNCPEYKTKIDYCFQDKTMHAFENHVVSFFWCHEQVIKPVWQVSFKMGWLWWTKNTKEHRINKKKNMKPVWQRWRWSWWTKEEKHVNWKKSSLATFFGNRAKQVIYCLLRGKPLEEREFQSSQWHIFEN